MVLEVSPAEDTTAIGYPYLPSPPRQIERSLLRTGVDGSELRKVCTMDNLPARVSDAIDIERESIDSLNRLCRTVGELDSAQRTKLDAVVLMAQSEDVGEIRQLTENLDQFDFIPGIKDPERNCQATDLGLVAYHGTLTLDELMRGDPAEQYIDLAFENRFDPGSNNGWPEGPLFPANSLKDYRMPWPKFLPRCHLVARLFN